jgi:hypothetical protein
VRVCRCKDSPSLLHKEEWDIWAVVVSLVKTHCYHGVAELAIALPGGVI